MYIPGIHLKKIEKKGVMSGKVSEVPQKKHIFPLYAG